MQMALNFKLFFGHGTGHRPRCLAPSAGLGAGALPLATGHGADQAPGPGEAPAIFADRGNDISCSQHLGTGGAADMGTRDMAGHEDYGLGHSIEYADAGHFEQTKSGWASSKNK
jgi:hypothetical protein